MKNMKMVDCMKGSAWEFPTGISPLGNCQHFLYENQSTPKKVQSKGLVWFVGFYGISTFVGYLTQNPFLCK